MPEHDIPNPNHERSASLPNLFLSHSFQEQYKDLTTRNLQFPDERGESVEVGILFDTLEAELLFDAISKTELLIENGKATPLTDYLSMIDEGENDHEDAHNPEHFSVVTLWTGHVVVVEQRPENKDDSGKSIYYLHFLFLNEKEFMRSLLSVPPTSP